jgi:hypothetical protein
MHSLPTNENDALYGVLIREATCHRMRVCAIRFTDGIRAGWMESIHDALRGPVGRIE